MIVVDGVGLHTGARARVTLARRAGPVTLNGTAIDALSVVDTARATTVAEPRVRTVEHLFAALAALGVRDGVAIEVEGPEVPLLDGGASSWCEFVSKRTVSPNPPRLRVLADRVLKIGSSVYRFERGASTAVGVTIDFGDPRLVADAAWNGDAEDFVARIAAARTFAFARELGDLASRGLASHVSPESVVVIADDAAHFSGRPFAWDEPARHKLLDLVGDLYVYGGPPIGSVHATRPGHAATHEAMRIAIAEGVVQSG